MRRPPRRADPDTPAEGDERRVELMLALYFEQQPAARRHRILRKLLVMLGEFEAARALTAVAAEGAP